MISRRRAAVLGAGGFLGSHLVEALLADGWEIDAVDRTFAKLETADGRVRRIQAHVAEAALLDEIVPRCEAVLSLTALCNPAQYNVIPLEVIDASYTDLLPLVERCSAVGRWLIHFSTCEVYGKAAIDVSGRPARAMSEENTGFLLGPLHLERWTYACAKQLLERVIWAHGRHRGLPFTIVRPFNVIGPKMDFVPGVDGEGVPRVLASFMGALLSGRELCLVDGGRRRRSFVAVQDFSEAIVRILQRPRVCQGQVLNIGNPANDVSVRELAEAMMVAFRRQVPSAPPARLREVAGEELYGPGYDDTEERVPDIDKARRLLGWRPRATLDAMLPPIVEDYVRRYGAALQRPRAVGDT